MRLASVPLMLTATLGMSSAYADRYQPPRVDGHPDLQGVWAHTNLTPFERPADITTFLISPAQARAIEAKINARNDDLSRPAEPSLYFDTRFVEPVRGTLRSSIVIEPANGRIPGNDLFKAKASRAQKELFTAFDGPEQRPGSERCLSAPSAAPPVMLVPASDLRQIVQTPHAIVIASEELHEARVIRMNAAHGPAAVTSWLGDSIGHWEDDTLVIETTNFAPSSEVRAGPNGLFIVSPRSKVTERLQRIAHNEMLYSFSVDDPTHYTQVWRGETRFTRSNARMLEYACHEGNYSLEYALR